MLRGLDRRERPVRARGGCVPRLAAVPTPLAPTACRRTTLAFLGWLNAEREITPGLGVFCRAPLSEWVEDWLKALREKGLKYSSMANYCNSLCMVASYVFQTYKVDEDALAMPVSPLDQTLRLRGQCESQAKQQSLCACSRPACSQLAALPTLLLGARAQTTGATPTGSSGARPRRRGQRRRRRTRRCQRPHPTPRRCSSCASGC